MSGKDSRAIQPLQPVEGADAPCKCLSLIQMKQSKLEPKTKEFYQANNNIIIKSLSEEETISFNDDRSEISVKEELADDF